MSDDESIWGDDFPCRETFEDFAGHKRTFVVNAYAGPVGYTVRAVEEKPGEERYEFAAFSETNPYSAAGHLRTKMRVAMATRHLDNGRDMLHDTLRGRITVNGDGDPIFVVDGLAVDMDDFARIVSSHEGWEFEFRIVSAM